MKGVICINLFISYGKTSTTGKFSFYLSLLNMLLYALLFKDVYSSLHSIIERPNASYLSFELLVRNIVLLFFIIIFSITGISIGLINKLNKKYNKTIFTSFTLFINSISLIGVVIYIKFGDEVFSYLKTLIN